MVGCTRKWRECCCLDGYRLVSTIRPRTPKGAPIEAAGLESPAPAGESEDPKRARILAATERVCIARGVASARMEEIAAEAKVSKGTLYRYFASKDDLLVAMVIESFDSGRREVDRARPVGLGPRAVLEHVLEGLGQVLARHAPRATIHYAAWGVVARDDALRRRLQDHLRRFFEARGREIRATLEDGVASGDFRADADLGAFTHAILALLSGFVFRSTFDPEGGSPDRLRAAYRALLHQSLLVAPEEGVGPEEGAR